MAFAAVMFTAFYLSAKLHAFTSNGHFFRLIPSLVLLACACAVAINRMDDYVASGLDAFAGAVIGTGRALLERAQVVSDHCSVAELLLFVGRDPRGFMIM